MASITSYEGLQAGSRPAPAYSRYIRRGLFLLFILVFGIGGWSVLASLQGAVIATGKVIVEGKPKTIQHMEGGIIREITVENGDFVEEGDTVMTLDATAVDAFKDRASQGFYETLAQIARLEAEREEASFISWPSEIQKASSSPYVNNARAGQSELFRVRKLAFSNNIERYREQIQQNRDAITGFEAQKVFENNRANSLQTELTSLRELLRQQIIPRTRVLTLERDLTDTQARLADNQSNIIQTQDRIREIEATIAQDTQERRSEVLAELRLVQNEYAQYKQELEVTADQKYRGDIRAPVSGKIHNFNVTTLGGVITPGQEIMQIVPTNQRLIIEASVMPQDIDKIYIGQPANIRFTAFNQKKTPEVSGSIKHISADRFDEEAEIAPHYIVQIELTDEELERLNGQELVSGMPVDTFIQTEKRSVINYLLKPLTDSFRHSMRES